MIHICTKYLGVETYEVMSSKAPFSFIFWNHVIIKPPKDAQPRDDLPALASMRSPEPYDSAVHGSSTSDVVMQPNPPEPVLAAPAPPVKTTVPPTPPRSNPEVPLGSVATGLERGRVTPKGTSKPVTRTSEQKDGEIRFAPVTAAGMSAFFAAIRRPSTQVSFTTEGSQDMEIKVATPPAPEATQVVAVAPATTQETAPASATQDVAVAPATAPSVAPATAESGMTEEPPVAAPASESGMARETPLVAPAPPQVITPAPEDVIPPAATPSPTEVRDVSGGSPDTFLADLTALANDTPEVTPPAPSDGTTPNGLVAALNNLADRIPSVADIADDGQTKKQAKAQYVRYYRSVRGPNCPDIIRRKFQEAQACSNQMESQAKIQALFEEFKHCNEDWLSSQIVLQEIRSHTTSHQGIWKWMTRDES